MKQLCECFLCVILLFNLISCKKQIINSNFQEDLPSEYNAIFEKYPNIKETPAGKFRDSISQRLIPIIIKTPAELDKALKNFRKITMVIDSNLQSFKEQKNKDYQRTTLDAYTYTWAQTNFTDDGIGWITYSASINWSSDPTYGLQVKLINSVSNLNSSGSNSGSGGAPYGNWTVAYSYIQLSSASSIAQQQQVASLSFQGNMTKYQKYEVAGHYYIRQTVSLIPFGANVWSSEFPDPLQ